MELNYNSPSNPPSGTYIVVSNDPGYRNWLNDVRLGETRYCPGHSSGVCSISGYSKHLDKLRAMLCILQEAREQIGLYFINTMLVLIDNDTLKHQLIVGPFNQNKQEDRVHGELI
jgi:hypothetical protein